MLLKKMENNIIDIGNNDCTGCSACSIICPCNAISINLSKDGFYVPIVDDDICNHCCICKEVCYKYLPESEYNPEKVYTDKKIIAVLNSYTEQLHSVSTAGVATKLAKAYFNMNNNVCGVSFNPKNNKCEHIIAFCDEDIERMKGSKYVQSNCFSALKNLVNQKKRTIVFGLPCQIYGLRKVLQRMEIDDHFVLIDMYCAGVPTLNLWIKYQDFVSRNFGLNEIKIVNFRDKSQGWHKFSLFLLDNNGVTYRQNLYNDMFFSFYLKKVCLNKACYNCKFRHEMIWSDIRLGDFWGKKYQNFDDGVELMVISTKKGEDTWNDIKSSFRFENAEIEDVYKSQKYNRIPMPNDYDEILNELSGDEKLEDIHSRFKINTKGY